MFTFILILAVLAVVVLFSGISHIISTSYWARKMEAEKVAVTFGQGTDGRFTSHLHNSK